MTKHIFVTGGVVSSLGKGLTCGSLGLLLESVGLTVMLQKLDPYINVDPGTMSPFQHGEVYVTLDGAETDLDLGHYERFTNTPVSKVSNYTTGSIYNAVITRERRGDYDGNTVQVIPHITDEIKAAIDRAATESGADVVITEIGGTVGDIESLPFLEALRQYGFDKGRENVMYIHLTLVPYLRTAGETKTKPTQQSVGKLREIGLMPDMLICRTSTPLSPENRAKIALFCNVAKEAVIEERDVEHSIYQVPLVLRDEGALDRILDRLGLDAGRASDLTNWEAMVDRLINPEREVDIAVIGKYINLQDAYKSIYEALTHAGVANCARVNVRRIESQELVDGPAGLKKLEGVGGILVPGGFGMRGIEGKVEAARYARENGIPYFGICLGMQCAVIEFARNVAGLEGANSSEFNPQTPHPVIDLMADQRSVTIRGGTMRLGGYECVLTPGTKAAASYEADSVVERHRHRYEFNNAYRERMAEAGLVFSGLSPDGKLVEMIELPDHPWYVAGQFHPEFQSKLTGCHPLFRDFVKAALKRGGALPAAENEAAASRS